MNLTISQDKKDLIDIVLLILICILIEGLKDTWEPGGTCQSYPWELLLINTEDVLNANNCRVHWIWIKRETVFNCAHTWWNTTKTKCLESLIITIWLNDLTHLVDCFDILVSLTKVMEWVWILWITIWCSEINCYCKGDLPSSHEIVHKAWYFIELELSKGEVSLTLL